MTHMLPTPAGATPGSPGGLDEFSSVAPALSRFHCIWRNIVFRETMLFFYSHLEQLCGKLQTHPLFVDFHVIARTRQGQLPVHSPGFCAQKGLILGLILSCQNLKILNNFIFDLVL